MATSDESESTRPWPTSGPGASSGGQGPSTPPPQGEPARTAGHYPGPTPLSEEQTSVVTPIPRGGIAGGHRVAPPQPAAAHVPLSPPYRPPGPAPVSYPSPPPAYPHTAGPVPRRDAVGGAGPWGPPAQAGGPNAARVPVPHSPSGSFAGFGVPGPPRRRRKVVFAAAGAALGVVVALVLVLGFWAPGFFTRTELDVGRAQNNIQTLLSDDVSGYGPGHVRDVVCNQGRNPVVQKGGTFVCDVTVDGTKRTITATFQDDQGAYQITLPQ